MEWWIDEGYVLASKNPSHEDLRRLRSEGFATLVSLLDERKEKAGYDVSSITEAGWTRHSVGIPEGGVPSIRQFEDFAAFVREAHPRGRIVVHCSTGAGRAATMGAAYWIDHGLSAAEAIEHIRQVNQHPWDTPERTAALQEFERCRINTGQATAKHYAGAALNLLVSRTN